MKTKIAGILFMLISTGALNAQLTKEDYERADTIRKLGNLIYFDDARPVWQDSTHILWYRVTTKRGKEYFLVDPVKKEKRPAFDHAKLCDAVNKSAGKSFKPFSMELSRLSFSKDLKTMEFVIDSKKYECRLRDYKTEQTDTVSNRWRSRGYWAESQDPLGNSPVKSPDEKWVAFIKDHNLYVKKASGKEEFQLSFDGSPGDLYSSYITWSPDSRKLVTNQVRPHEKRYFHLVESSPADQLQPKLHKREYLKPGDALPISRPRLFDLEGKSQITFDTGPFENQYSLGRIEWYKDSRGFTFEFNQRGHQVYQVVYVDAETGDVNILVDERSPTFIDYSSKRTRYDVNDGREIIWASERDGWNHLYLFDGITGEIKNQITRGEWVFRNLIHVNEDERWILFEASGMHAGEDPYHRHVYRINFDGSGLTELTPENANHRPEFSYDYTYFTDKYSRVDLPSVTVLRSGKDGEILMKLEGTDISELVAEGYRLPEVFSAKARDGETDIWGLIYRPLNFDENNTYPVIESIYAGPHGSHVPKDFMGIPGYGKLAELGFIIVQIDGLGTSNRSKAFHDVCWQNLKDAGFPDRILWIKSAAEKYPYMDTTRVGIFGTSAGGQNAAGAVLFHPGFYDVAVASCGCHDNRMDKIWWNEQWMGYPVGPHYADNSNVTHAANLKGKLMLLLGELDDNVDPSSTMQLVDALIKANKEFEFVMLPGLNHTSGGSYGDRKRIDFFIRHLHGFDPPDWNRH